MTPEARAIVDTLGRALARLRSAMVRAHLIALTGLHARLTEVAGR